MPSIASELPLGTDVPFDVALALLLPEFSVSRGDDAAVATSVHVPEAAMDKDCDPSTGHYYVRFSRKVFTVQPVPDAHFAE
jgi:hypothetical protein